MNLSQCSILSIELSQKQAIDLKQIITDAMKKYGYSNFETLTEIKVPSEDDEPIAVYVQAKITTLYSPSFEKFRLNEPPQAEYIEGHEVDRESFKISLFHGNSEVQFYAPFSLDEEIIKHIEKSLIN